MLNRLIYSAVPHRGRCGGDIGGGGAATTAAATAGTSEDL